jgi:hypothetical protein
MPVELRNPRRMNFGPRGSSRDPVIEAENIFCPDSSESLHNRNKHSDITMYYMKQLTEVPPTSYDEMDIG